MFMQFRKPRITQDTKGNVITDYSNGMLVREILKKHNISQATLYNIIRKEIK